MVKNRRLIREPDQELIEIDEKALDVFHITEPQNVLVAY